MKTFTIELDTTEIIKLNAICNAAIVNEEETLRFLSETNQKVIDNTKASIEKIWELKAKIKNVINSSYSDHIKIEERL